MKKRIAIIGAGKMGQAIAKSLLERQLISQGDIILTRKTVTELDYFKNKWHVIVTDNNNDAIIMADIIIIAVKPQSMNILLQNIKGSINAKHLIISIAAGVTTQNITKIIGLDKAVIRVMPNLAAQVGESFSVWVKNNHVNKDQKTFTKRILQAIGLEIELSDEKLFDAITAISGSGPAYIFYIAEILQEAAIKLGIPKDISNILAKQTIMGSTMLLQHSYKTPEDLRKEVTSEGGTTEAAFAVLKKEKINERFFKGIKAAVERSQNLKLK